MGTIIEEKGEIAVVRLRRHLSCENCGRCGGVLGGEDRREHFVEALNPIRARTGQSVLIEMDDRRALFIAFMLYMVPLTGLVGGIVCGLKAADYLGWAAHKELLAAGIGAAVMALIYSGISFWDRRVKKSGRYRPVIAALALEQESEGAAD